jgi:NADH-quinone oxidoreductase subunit F
MAAVERVLALNPVASLESYGSTGGGGALTAARKMSPEAVIDLVDASGLRGRGGAGFPTGRKWRIVAANRSSLEASTVVVNAAEGEPGSFKDRAILRADPYRVLEGALIAAHAIGADKVIVALKRTFVPAIERLRVAAAEISGAGWTDGIEVDVFEGPSEYLYGEETALLEAIDGRYPFPRIAPPYRRGVDEIVETPADVESDSASAAHVEMAGPGSETIAPPTLASNVETYANIAGIILNGVDWFRSVGTDEAPGTIVCTVSGCTQRSGVAEFAMGTPLREVIETIGGGPRDAHQFKALMSGVANALVAVEHFDTPVSYEAMAAIGSGLGAAGFIVFDDTSDLAAVAAGVARFLAVESCGQCTPCKQDGLALATTLDRIARSQSEEGDLDVVASRLATIADGARCNLASQQQVVIQSILGEFGDELAAHVSGAAEAQEPDLIAPIADLVDGQAYLDEHQRDKQPDWTFNAVDSGESPADRLDDHRAEYENL